MPTDSTALVWSCFAWTALDRDRLYAVLNLRERVFVVEQACAYLDCDGNDPKTLHLLGHADGTLAAYARIVPPGVFYEEPAIGRVVVDPAWRSGGRGRALMREAIARTHAHFGARSIRINAQVYLERFYRELGFVPASEPYDEDGIPHLAMLLPA